MNRWIGFLLILPVTLAGCRTMDTTGPVMPRIEGDWWQVAGNPDLGPLTGPPASNPNHPQEPVDFAIWQAADDTWQIWSCIRNTACGGNTRLFHGWESDDLYAADWTPQGIKMQADLKYETRVGGLQAPHVVLIDDVYHMIYGDWDYMMIQRSDDGKRFERWLYDETGRPGMFTEGKDKNTRDPCLIRIGDSWHVYYTAYPEVDGRKTGGVYCRTSKDLRQWSESTLVARGGLTGSNPYSSECPHVVKIGKYFYLFRTQRYAHPPVTSVFRSKDPMDFGVDEEANAKFVRAMAVAAPELFQYDGRWFIAALATDVQGIRIARLGWIPDDFDN